MNVKIIILGLSLFTFIGCHKDTATPQEDLVATVLGNYQVKTLTIDGKSYTLPAANATSQLAVSRMGTSLTELSVEGNYQLTTTNSIQQGTFTQTAPLTKQGTTISFTSTTSTGKMDGTYEANQLTVQYAKTAGSTIIVVATK